MLYFYAESKQNVGRSVSNNVTVWVDFTALLKDLKFKLIRLSIDYNSGVYSYKSNALNKSVFET